MRFSLSTEEPIRDGKIPLNSTNGMSANGTANGRSLYNDASNNPAIVKSKDIPYIKPGVGKYYRCGEPEHKSNEWLKRRLVNTADYEGKDDVLVETEPEDSDFVEEHGESIACVGQKVLCN